MDCSLPGSSIPGIFQARVLEWGAIAFSVVLFKWSPNSLTWLTGLSSHGLPTGLIWRSSILDPLIFFFFIKKKKKKENGLHLVSSFLHPRGHFQNLANLSKKSETECCKCHQSNVQSRNWFLNNLQLSITGLKWVKTVKMASTYDCGLGSPWRTLWALPYLFLNHPVPSSFPVHTSWAHKSWLGAPSAKHYCWGWCVWTWPCRYCWDW